MKTHSAKIAVQFNAPVEKVYALLNDHVTLGKIYHTKMKRIVDSTDLGNLNGVGSVRIFSIVTPIEETIVKSEKNKLIDYTMTKGMHFFSSHYGTMVFTALDENSCKLNYTITIGIKIPVISKLIINMVAADLQKKLIQLNKKLRENPDYSPV